tara:strand:- start:468 stop:1466 length:999 start_codon:yes stop_codon:yes gene_type:complete
MYPSDRKKIKESLYRLRQESGLEYLNKKYIHIWGHSHLINTNKINKVKNHLKQFLRKIYLQEIKFSGYEPLKDVNKITKAIQSKKYKWAIGYSTAFQSIAKYYKENKIDISNQLKYIILTAESIPENDYLLIKDIFNCPVIKEYGMAEAGVIAYSSIRNQNYKFDNKDYHIDILCNTDKSLEKHLSQILITTYDRVFPLIRYLPDDYFSDIKQRNQQIYCKEILGRNIDKTLRFPLINGNYSEKYNEVFIVHCIKPLKEIFQTTTYVTPEKHLRKIRVYYLGKKTEYNLKKEILRVLSEEVNGLNNNLITIEICRSPLKTIAGKSINYQIIN